MSTTAISNFTVTGWSPTTYQEAVDSPTLARVTVTKTFEGDVAGTSTAELLTCQSAGGGAGYIAQEIFEGSIADRTGTFVMQHGGIHDGTNAAKSFGNVVPGSATGALTGLRGELEYQHDENGAVFTLRYFFE